MSAFKKLDLYLVQNGGWVEIRDIKSEVDSTKKVQLLVEIGDRAYEYVGESNQRLEAIEQAARKACEDIGVD